MGDDYPRAIDLVSSGHVNVRAMVTHRESLDAAPDVFEALAQNPARLCKGALLSQRKRGDGPK
jgi:L-iditol 2-dehydrogenase